MEKNLEEMAFAGQELDRSCHVDLVLHPELLEKAELLRPVGELRG